MNVRALVFAAAVSCVLASSGAAGLGVSLPRRPSDGYDDVKRVSLLVSEGKQDEARAFLAELRSRSADGRNLEERQSVDMAEFALLRSDPKANKARCVECLKAVYDAGCTSFWGWAAYSFLRELGVNVSEPPKDPLRGLGALGDGVINLEPEKLKVKSGKLKAGGRGDGEWLAAATKAVAIGGAADLKPGSAVRRAILRRRLVEICGREKIEEILSAKGGPAFFARLWEDDSTLEDFLLSGPVFDPPRALETLMTLFLNDEDDGWSKTAMGRRATVAVAINAQKGDDLAATVRHWAAFRRIGRLGRFENETAEYDCREWRFIVRRPVDPADTLYLNAIIDFPKRYITNLSIRNVPYRKKNCFGEKMFINKYKRSGGFYLPWKDAGWPAPYLHSRVGGVCVEQANWATLCANAHGRMALFADQPERPATKYSPRLPAHRCWLLREKDGNWRIVNGCTPYTKARFSLWGRTFQHIVSVERAFADRDAHDESDLLLFAGRVREAAMRCPYNWPAWRAYADSLNAANPSIDEWRRYLGDLLRLMPEGRLVAWDFAHEALDALEAKGLDKKELAKLTARVFLALPQPKAKIAEEMDFAKDALGRSLKRFAGDAVLGDKILAVALEANKESSAYLPQIFVYALAQFGRDKERLGRFLSYAAAFGGEKRGDGGSSSGSIDWRSLMAMRAFQEDRSAFRLMADFRNENDPPKGSASVAETDYGASLVSSDALVRLSSSGKDDTPEDRPRVSDSTPYDPARSGLFRTKAETAPWAIVELAGSATLKGVTVIGASEALAVWLSDDGEEWRSVTPGTVNSGVLRVDLRRKPQTAKFVKVGFAPGGKKKALALKKILVYGDPLY